MLRINEEPVRTGLSRYFALHEHQRSIIVCEEKKLIYMKPAKTAGTSILRNSLQKHLPGIIHLKDHPEKFQAWLQKTTDEELEEYFIFSVVRNPWDRLVSVASYLNIPFHDFIHNMQEYRNDPRIRAHSWPLHLYTHYDGNRFVDMICRFECLQSDFNLICDEIGITREKLPFSNKSKHEHYSKYYGDEEYEIVADLYTKDIAYFGYMFEPEQTLNIETITARILARKARNFLLHLPFIRR